MLPEIIGKKVRFISTADRPTELKSGDIVEGTIKDISVIQSKFGGMLNRGRRTDKRVIEVILKDGSTISLVEGIDRFEILDR
jgi:hypothetical protein